MGSRSPVCLLGSLGRGRAARPEGDGDVSGGLRLRRVCLSVLRLCLPSSRRPWQRSFPWGWGAQWEEAWPGIGMAGCHGRLPQPRYQPQPGLVPAPGWPWWESWCSRALPRSLAPGHLPAPPSPTRTPPLTWQCSRTPLTLLPGPSLPPSHPRGPGGPTAEPDSQWDHATKRLSYGPVHPASRPQIATFPSVSLFYRMGDTSVLQLS